MLAFFSFLSGYVLSQFFRSFLAVIAPELGKELGLDPQALAALQTAWILGFIVMQFPVGWALDALGPRRTVPVTMVAAVIGALLFAKAESGFVLQFALVLIGIGCSAIYMGAVYVFGRIYPPQRFALLCSWLIGIGSAGNLIAASPLAYATSLIGWRGAMVGMAVITALVAILLAFIIRNPPRVTTARAVGLIEGLRTIFSLRALWPLLPISTISYAVLIAERGLWAGPYLTDVFGLAPVERGTILLIMAASMSAGALIYGPLDRVFGGYKWISVIGTAITAAGFLGLALFEPSLTRSAVLLSVLGAAGMTYGVLMAHGRAFVPDHLLGRGITFLNILFIGGAAIIQPISGAVMKQLLEGPPQFAYAVLHGGFAVLLLMSLAIYLVSKDVRRDHL
ncbi:MAG: MFS transporter [Alphaproteobacteria bacterium]